ncbi:GntR family transcriptional regulator [Salmonella enterica]|uniref:GntR family transcriptional regulator n=1 Tax=Salmonella newport TaxID=108619 RepID=A0A752CDM0_SALNE|nr:GntR family transcriptional regulator [Salmonella enterica]EKQ9812595.1 GntR family transcriptional regulator [Salmonella enterica subsp. enterica serovar Newport]ECO9822332.1 GntR family transcriptional regulator [Salmonella enterica]EGW7197433.1 GntR family transcriptional regulator [Salmonella enterica]EIW2893227.1 GntR family transcriptional regulator [Salmonella enterica]
MVDNHSLKIDAVPVTLRELALTKVRQAIIAGYFKAGDRLVERQLTEQLGVSRSVVREVIRYLEAEGLIETLPKKGPIVAVLNWKSAEQIYKIRMLLEQEAACDCARLASDDDKRQLHQQLQLIAQASREQDDIKRVEASQAFYETLFRVAKHTIAWEIVQRLNSRISRLRALTLASPERQVAGFERMSRIYGAIENNDPQQARQAVLEHLTEAAQLAKQILSSQE